MVLRPLTKRHKTQPKIIIFFELCANILTFLSFFAFFLTQKKGGDADLALRRAHCLRTPLPHPLLDPHVDTALDLYKEKLRRAVRKKENIRKLIKNTEE